MSDSEFWNLSHAQYIALRQAYEERERRMDHRFAALMCLIANIFRERSSPYEIEDFLKSERYKCHEMTDEDMRDAIISIHKTLEGIDGDRQC